jgi:hypothetical protein
MRSKKQRGGDLQRGGAAADELFRPHQAGESLKRVAPINIVRRNRDRAGATLTVSFQRIFLN